MKLIRPFLLLSLISSIQYSFPAAAAAAAVAPTEVKAAAEESASAPYPEFPWLTQEMIHFLRNKSHIDTPADILLCDNINDLLGSCEYKKKFEQLLEILADPATNILSKNLEKTITEYIGTGIASRIEEYLGIDTDAVKDQMIILFNFISDPQKCISTIREMLPDESEFEFDSPDDYDPCSNLGEINKALNELAKQYSQYLDYLDYLKSERKKAILDAIPSLPRGIPEMIVDYEGNVRFSEWIEIQKHIKKPRLNSDDKSKDDQPKKKLKT